MSTFASEPLFKKGDYVRLKVNPSERGVIVEGPLPGITQDLYKVFFGSRESMLQASALQLDVPEQALQWVDLRRFLREFAVLKLSNQFTDVLYSMGASRTKFLVYQFQPVLKFVQALPHGMLIADEVGLGKTIEAGLILKEFIARGAVQRVLVLCPANLRQKWRSEMQQRFGLQFREINARDIRDIRRSIDTLGWPAFMGVASLEGLRRDELREALQETGIQFDMVIIDEAHHLRNPATLSFELGEVLADQADHILLLSATPVQTGATDLLSLLRIIEPAQFRGTSSQELEDLLAPNAHINAALKSLSRIAPDPVEVRNALQRVLGTHLGSAYSKNPLFQSCMDVLDGVNALSPQQVASLQQDLKRLHTLGVYFTRTRKREVEESARRRSRVIEHRLSLQEEEFYSAWVEYVTELASVRTPGAPIAWVASMRERQAASCLPAAAAALRDLLEGEAPNDIESTDPDSAYAGIGQVSAGDGRLTLARERVSLAAKNLGQLDTKAERLVDLVHQLLQARPERKILVFAFFKGTVHHLRQRLRSASIRLESMTGDDPPEARADIVDRFRESDASVLLTTEVGAEGLDFQFCDTVINYDLPWNPMRVEQRIGRIDRYGQQQPFIDVASFFVENTIDTRILERLYTRVRVFEESIGELEPILGPIVQQLQTEVFTQRLTDEELARRAEEAVVRAENLRRQNEEFEASRAELLGHGSLVREEIESLRQSGRFVTPEELQALVAAWLDASPYGADSLRSTSRPGIWDLALSQATIGRVYQKMASEHRNDDPAASRLLGRLQREGHAWCTFDSEVAQTLDNLPFLDVAHPIVRLALEDTKGSVPRNPFSRLAAAYVEDRTDIPPEGIVLFVYRLEVHGSERRLNLLPVAVNAGNGEVLPDCADPLLGSLPKARNSLPRPSLDEARLRSLEERSLQYADQRRSELEEWALVTDAARRATQRAGLSRSYEARIARKRELLGRISDERIRRLYEGEIRNLEANFEAKLRDLELAPAPFAELELLAAVFFSGQPA
jgi:SNF2 family DNA or RNA helicase